MADTNDNLSPGFSIQGTMEMGVGDQTLLQGLYEPETSTSNPEDVTPIIKDAIPPTTAKPDDNPKGKQVTPPAAATGDDENDESKKGQSLISNFMGSNEDDDEHSTTSDTTTLSPDDNIINDDEGSQYTALSNDLFKLGVFTKEDEDVEEEIKTPEQFLEKFNSEKKRGASEMIENFLGQFGEDYRNAFAAIFVKGVSPQDYFGTYNNVVNFAEMDLSDEANQIKIMKQTLKDQDFDPEDIESEIERLKNYGDLESVATKHHKVLVKKEAHKLQQMEADAEQELQQKAAIKNQYVQNVQNVLQDKLKTKDFDGIPLNPKLANELQDFLLVDKWKTTSGETLTDFDRTILDLKRPENHGMKVKVALLLKILEKDPTLSTIQKTGVTNKTNTLFTEVARQVTKKATTSSASSANNTKWFL